jgi:hypothetical protein
VVLIAVIVLFPGGLQAGVLRVWRTVRITILGRLR